MANQFENHFWQIGKLSFPLTLATAAGTILVFIDSLFATRISVETYEAVFLAIPILGIATAIGVGLAAAIADLISKESELHKIKRYMISSFVLATICIVACIYIGFFHRELIETFSGLESLPSSSGIVMAFRAYWDIIVWTLSLQILFALTIQYLTIIERQWTGIWIIILMLGINVFLDYLFTVVMSWGVQGLVYSTMGVFTFGLLVSAFYLRRETFFQRPFPSITDIPFIKSLGRLTAITLMIFLTIVIFSIASIYLNKMALALSSTSLVVFAIFRQIIEVAVLTTRGLSGGFIIYLSQAFRNKQSGDYFSIYWAGTAWIGIINLFVAALMIFQPELLVGLFENIDMHLMPDIQAVFYVGAAILILFILPRLAQIGFISLDKTVYLVLFSVVFVGVMLISAYYLIEDYGVLGLAYAELAASVTCCIIFLPLFFYLLYQRSQVDRASTTYIREIQKSV